MIQWLSMSISHLQFLPATSCIATTGWTFSGQCHGDGIHPSVYTVYDLQFNIDTCTSKNVCPQSCSKVISVDIGVITVTCMQYICSECHIVVLCAYDSSGCVYDSSNNS